MEIHETHLVDINGHPTLLVWGFMHRRIDASNHKLYFIRTFDGWQNIAENEGDKLVKTFNYLSAVNTPIVETNRAAANKAVTNEIVSNLVETLEDVRYFLTAKDFVHLPIYIQVAKAIKNATE